MSRYCPLLFMLRKTVLCSGRFSLFSVAVAGGSGSALTGDDRSRIKLEFGLAVLPHPQKVQKGGEDAFFYSHATSSFGIADGVGAWSSMGINPAKYSRALMRYTESAIAACASSDEQEPISPCAALRVAYDQVREQGIQGSCTAVVGRLHEDRLMLANLGDSGVMLLSRIPRQDEGNAMPLDGGVESSTSKMVPKPSTNSPKKSSPIVGGYQIVYKTLEQQHRFNCPYQLGIESSDEPEAASVTNHQVRVGDLIIAGSDGLWDNLFDFDIQRLSDESDDVQELAFILATAAHRRALKTSGSRATPFAKNASDAGILFEGGKIDDITVIVGRVVIRDYDQIRSRL